jgi:hypothetical protein
LLERASTLAESGRYIDAREVAEGALLAVDKSSVETVERFLANGYLTLSRIAFLSGESESYKRYLNRVFILALENQEIMNDYLAIRSSFDPKSKLPGIGKPNLQSEQRLDMNLPLGKAHEFAIMDHLLFMGNEALQSLQSGRTSVVGPISDQKEFGKHATTSTSEIVPADAENTATVESSPNRVEFRRSDSDLSSLKKNSKSKSFGSVFRKYLERRKSSDKSSEEEKKIDLRPAEKKQKQKDCTPENDSAALHSLIDNNHERTLQVEEMGKMRGAEVTFTNFKVDESRTREFSRNLNNNELALDLENSMSFLSSNGELKASVGIQKTSQEYEKSPNAADSKFIMPIENEIQAEVEKKEVSSLENEKKVKLNASVEIEVETPSKIDFRNIVGDAQTLPDLRFSKGSAYVADVPATEFVKMLEESKDAGALPPGAQQNGVSPEGDSSIGNLDDHPRTGPETGSNVPPHTSSHISSQFLHLSGTQNPASSENQSTQLSSTILASQEDEMAARKSANMEHISSDEVHSANGANSFRKTLEFIKKEIYEIFHSNSDVQSDGGNTSGSSHSSSGNSSAILSRTSHSKEEMASSGVLEKISAPSASHPGARPTAHVRFLTYFSWYFHYLLVIPRLHRFRT